MRKRIVLFLVLGVLVSLCLQAQAASNYDAEIAALKAESVQFRSRLAEIERALAQFNDNAAKDIADKGRLLQGVGNSVETINKRVNSADSSILALTKKQDEIEKRLTTSEVQMAVLTKKQNDYEVANADVAAALRILATLGATKESTQGRKIIRQGSGDSFRRDSESRRLSDATQESISQNSKTIRQGSGNSYAAQPRKIQTIREIPPRPSERAETAESARTVRIVHYAQRVPSRTSHDTPRPGPDIADIWTKKDKDDDQDGFYTKVDWSSLRR